jgi:hypothetical protein
MGVLTDMLNNGHADRYAELEIHAVKKYYVILFDVLFMF